ncbi:unnamed protein product [Camellia sinensis]
MALVEVYIKRWNCIEVRSNEMGSEGPKGVTIHVTGFKKFQGVAENPTETMVSNLKTFVGKRGLLAGVTLGSCTVLETAGDGALPMLYKIMELGVANGNSSNEQVVWVGLTTRLFIILVIDLWKQFGEIGNYFQIERVKNVVSIYLDKIKPMKEIGKGFHFHSACCSSVISCQNHTETEARAERENRLHFGVNNGAVKFAIERQAVNEATFCCPDEFGWQPQQRPIVHEDGETSRARETSCPVEAILQFLKKKGFDATISDDAGRFVCNYVYYHSLRIDEATQMQFAATLLEAIASTC